MTLVARPHTEAPPTHHRLVEDVRADSAAHGISPRTGWWLAAFPIAGGIAMLATFAYRPLFIWILREDHPIEWLQFTLDLFTTIVAGLAAAGFARRRQWLLAATFAAFALGCLALAGEEISWGQRAFSFSTPEAMEEANDQSEFNLHNLDGAHGGLNLSSALRMVQLAVAAGGALLPPLTGLNRSPVRRVAYLRALSPPVVLVPAFAMAFAVRLADLGLRVINHLPDALIYYLEWGEFCLDLGLAGMAVCARTTLLGRFQGRHSHRTANGRAVAASPLTPMVVILAAGCLLVTFVLAMMTMQTGILPGNVKG